MIIVSDTTSLIVLEELDSINLLCELFDKVIVPTVVMDGIKVGSPDIYATFELLSCFEITDVADESIGNGLRLSEALQLQVREQLISFA